MELKKAQGNRMSITFNNRQEAREYAISKEREGYRTKTVGCVVTIIGEGKPMKIEEKLHSTRPEKLDIEEVAFGNKPAAFVNKGLTHYAKSLGLEVYPVDKGYRSILPQDIIVVKKGNKQKAERIIEILKKYPLEIRGEEPQYDRELGRELGYPEEDIDFYERIQ